MKKHEITGSGFQVIHNSDAWRIAVHSYEEEVNGISSVKNWGIHEDSEEAFFLMEGRAWLITSEAGQEAEDFCIHILEPGCLLVVETGERHAILTAPGTRVLIAENRDMSRSRNEPVPEEVIRAVREAWEAAGQVTAV